MTITSLRRETMLYLDSSETKAQYVLYTFPFADSHVHLDSRVHFKDILFAR